MAADFITSLLTYGKLTNQTSTQLVILNLLK